MANWQYRVNIKSIWETDNMTIEDKGKVVAQIIRRTFPISWLDWKSDNYDQELEQIAEAFENITGYDDVSPIEEFDDWLRALYDYGDTEVVPFGQWPPNKMAWIATIF